MPFTPEIVKSTPRQVKRVMCPIHGVITHTLVMALAPILTKTGKVSKRSIKIHACPDCYRETGEVLELGRE